MAACQEAKLGGPDMATTDEASTIREAVGVFHDRESFLRAVDELLSDGFDRADLSLLACERTVEGKLGHAYKKVQDLEDDAAVPRVAFVDDHSLKIGRTGIIGGLAYVGAVAAAGAVVASGGALAATVAAAAVAGGGGGLLGAVGASMLGRDHAQALKEQLDRGGLLLWVNLRDEAARQRASDILTRNGAEDVHVHDLPASEIPADNPLKNLEFDPFLPGARI
jgi:hypothetical protein